MPTSAARSSACCPWSTRCCCWSMPRRGRCRRRASSPARRSSMVCVRSWSSTRSTVRVRARTGCIDQVFDLFDRLGASDEQLDFPIIYASALNGYAGLDNEVREGDMTPLFEAIVEHCPAPEVDPDSPFQMQISTLDYSSFVGAIALGRIRHGSVRPNQQIVVVKPRRRALQGQGRPGLRLSRAGAPRSAARHRRGHRRPDRHRGAERLRYTSATRITPRPCRR